MKTLHDIVSSLSILQRKGPENVAVSGIEIDSRAVGAGSLFVAVSGTRANGHDFIARAVEQGASCIVCSRWPDNVPDKITVLQVKDSAEAAGLLAAAFYDHPGNAMKVVGITGTNGKTTCATLLYHLFHGLGYRCGLLSTVQNEINGEVVPSTHTTPDAVSLHRLLSEMKDAGCTHVFMEVSSHAVHQQRIAGLTFAGACFTNITHDHLDYHGSFDEYILVKKSFFDDLPDSAFALTNADDKRGAVMLQNTLARRKTYSLRNMADYKGKILENNLSGLVMQINGQDVHLRLIGEFNAYNILCVFGAACELGEDPQEVLRILSALHGAEGRFDYIVSPKEKVLGIVDYAHTPDALLNVLATVNKLRKGDEVLCTVVGCGGDRDRTKRPLMALVACEHSDKVIFTADNPRSEDPMDIIREMEAGVPVHQRRKFLSIADRLEAIKAACSMSEAGDIILVAGKGHEKYQEVQGVKQPFDDKETLQAMFNFLEK